LTWAMIGLVKGFRMAFGRYSPRSEVIEYSNLTRTICSNYQTSLGNQELRFLLFGWTLEIESLHTLLHGAVLIGWRHWAQPVRVPGPTTRLA
jgi:hypothetical protein